jgi:hypothetical protein
MLRKIFGVLWFFIPVLVIMAFTTAALFVLAQFMTGHWSMQ